MTSVLNFSLRIGISESKGVETICETNKKKLKELISTTSRDDQVEILLQETLSLGSVTEESNTEEFLTEPNTVSSWAKVILIHHAMVFHRHLLSDFSFDF